MAADHAGSADAVAVLAAAGDLAACSSESELREQVLSLSALVGTDGILTADMRPAADRRSEPVMSADVSDPSVYGRTIATVFSEHWRDHPIVVRHMRRPTPQAVTLADFSGADRWLRIAILHELFRARRPPYEAGVQVTWSPARVRCVALHRDVPFTARDREVLDLIAPHLRAAHRRVAAAAGQALRLALLERGLEVHGEGAVLVGRDGR
ncbi:MAG TPA: hypothetical protein VNT55_25040, partial [Baekduia sp.]|nr:hypothetical protein [Baekduia sp.]